MPELEKARKDIERVDREMAKLFEERMRAVEEVAAYKKEKGLPVEDPAREDRLIAQNAAYIENEAYKPFYIGFERAVMKISKDYQHRLLDGVKVAYSGVVGAFADIVSRRVFPDALCTPYPDFKSAYASTENGESDLVVLPIENSFNGDVGQVMDLAFFGKLFINGIYEYEIEQNLLACKGADLQSVKKVISHPQALGQCAAYIEKNGFETEEAVNTALAAKYVAECGRTDLAAIGSREAAERFGLVILDKAINESGVNTTRFAVFSRAMRDPQPGDDRFILLFTVKNAAGALGKAVSVIGEHGYNLRALKSRPTKDLSWEYYFWAEGEGSIAGDKGERMLAELSKHCSDLRLVGSFEKEIKV